MHPASHAEPGKHPHRGRSSRYLLAGTALIGAYIAISVLNALYFGG